MNFKKLIMKYSLTLIELFTVVVFIGILLLINLPIKHNNVSLLTQQHEVTEQKSLKCRKLYQ